MIERKRKRERESEAMKNWRKKDAQKIYKISKQLNKFVCGLGKMWLTIIIVGDRTNRTENCVICHDICQFNSK